jgi:predicted RNase H-like nuclease
VIAGVDGCKDRWIVVTEDAAGHTTVREPCAFTQLYQDEALDLIVIDIPIGLPDKGPRQADLGARRFLKHRHVCVFPAPIRPVLSCSSREGAYKTCLAVGDKRVNVFQWAIVPKVKTIDLVLRQHKNIQHRIREGHPEVSFALMNENVPLLSKKKAMGIEQRIKLLTGHFPDMRTETSHLEDVLDAYALLWTARRIRMGTERRFPDVAELDPIGLRMEISA